MRKKKKKFDKNKYFYILGLLILLIIILFGLLIRAIIPKKAYYSVDSRVNALEKKKKTDVEGDHTTIGWLKVQGTNIDLPVIKNIQGNEKYPVEVEDYVWSLAENDKMNNVINIMGHNIMNLGYNPKLTSDSFHRFEELMDFVYYDFAKKNKYIQLTYDGKDYLYKVISVGFIYPLDVILLPKNDYSDVEKDKFFSIMKDISIYDYDVDYNKNDEFLNLMTCTRMLGKKNETDFIVSARKVRVGEKIDDYSVVKNDEYKRIDDALKGVFINDKDDSD